MFLSSLVTAAADVESPNKGQKPSEQPQQDVCELETETKKKAANAGE